MAGVRAHSPLRGAWLTEHCQQKDLGVAGAQGLSELLVSLKVTRPSWEGCPRRAWGRSSWALRTEGREEGQERAGLAHSPSGPGSLPPAQACPSTLVSQLPLSSRRHKTPGYPSPRVSPSEGSLSRDTYINNRVCVSPVTLSLSGPLAGPQPETKGRRREKRFFPPTGPQEGIRAPPGCLRRGT